MPFTWPWPSSTNSLVIMLYSRGSWPNLAFVSGVRVVDADRSAATPARDCSAARSSGGRSSSSKLTMLLQPWRSDVPMQSAPVSPPPMTITSRPFGGDVLAVVELRVEQALRVARSGTPSRSGCPSGRGRGAAGRVERLGRAGGQQDGVVLGESCFGSMNCIWQPRSCMICVMWPLGNLLAGRRGHW